MRALQAHREGWRSEGIWEKDRHEHGAQADRMSAQPEQPLVSLAPFSADFHTESSISASSASSSAV